ncbi:hypothetical protein QYE76_027017 [Lolium multiflorum]|uniref:Uncharacterized protein n=1 Tax=Lolium multiflorum TaxID=4521 RepID=A0AAD8Q3M4_LOLMU|nr:hypothetical protein QYE76_027017 [Lolium multiflorum]
MENYSLFMGAAAVMKMAVEMAVSMEKPSGTSPSGKVPEQTPVPRILASRWRRLGKVSRTVASSPRYEKPSRAAAIAKPRSGGQESLFRHAAGRGSAPEGFSIDTTAIFTAIAVSHDEEGVVLPRLRAVPKDSKGAAAIAKLRFGTESCSARRRTGKCPAISIDATASIMLRMATLRSALRRLAPAAGFLSRGSRGSSGPSVTAKRNIFTHAGGFRAFCSERFSPKRPETWFAVIAIVFGATYRVKVQTYPEEWNEASSSTILRDSDTSCGQQEEQGKALNSPIT